MIFNFSLNEWGGGTSCKTTMKKIKKLSSNISTNSGGAVMPMERLFVYIIMAVIAVLFTGLSGAFIYAGIHHGFHTFRLPAIFHANTLIIILSSIMLEQAIRAMGRNEGRAFLYGLAVSFLLGVSFLLFQFMGWHELMQRGIKINTLPFGSYLYMLSGLHALHLLVGVVLVGIALVRAVVCYFNPVKQLLFTIDAYRKDRIVLTALYWHFVDILWVALYVLFVLVLLLD